MITWIISPNFPLHVAIVLMALWFGFWMFQGLLNADNPTVTAFTYIIATIGSILPFIVGYTIALLFQAIYCSVFCINNLG